MSMTKSMIPLRSGIIHFYATQGEVDICVYTYHLLSVITLREFRFRPSDGIDTCKSYGWGMEDHLVLEIWGYDRW